MRMDIDTISLHEDTIFFTYKFGDKKIKKEYKYSEVLFQNQIYKEICNNKEYQDKFFIVDISDREIALITYDILDKTSIYALYNKYKRRIACYYMNKEGFEANYNKLKEIQQKYALSKIDEIFADLNKKQGKKDFLIKEEYSDITNTLSTDSPIVIKGMTAIILEGIEKKASDVHIEPGEIYTRIRYRVDGILIEGKRLSSKIHGPFISRLKIMSKLDITEKRMPQDGKFQLTMNGNDIDFRISVIPTTKGEKAVIRILDKKNDDIKIETLGLSKEHFEVLSKEIKRTKGIILASGPTGSGKSSLLYAILKKINDGKINISSVEDPVEYEMEGINQVQCQNDIGRDFAVVLRAFLRQDPDVIMIGEIRDKETAEIAMKSAITGHLVLSTIHTNDAVGSIYRLMDMGIKPYMISASLDMVVAQRLVRRLCPHCKEIDIESKAKLEILTIDAEKYKSMKFYRAKGCSKCNSTGYMGRLAIFEILIPDDEIRQMISLHQDHHEIYEKAREKGMKTLYEDGIIKAGEGITSLDEIIRQC